MFHAKFLLQGSPLRGELTEISYHSFSPPTKNTGVDRLNVSARHAVQISSTSPLDSLCHTLPFFSLRSLSFLSHSAPPLTCTKAKATFTRLSFPLPPILPFVGSKIRIGESNATKRRPSIDSRPSPSISSPSTRRVADSPESRRISWHVQTFLPFVLLRGEHPSR